MAVVVAMSKQETKPEHRDVLGILELRRGGTTRGFVVGSFWRTEPTAMGTEKDAETAKIALIAACDAHDLLAVLP